jgi:hypothetical protein
MISMFFDICLNLTSLDMMGMEVFLVMIAVLFLTVPVNLGYICFNQICQEICTILTLFFKITVHMQALNLLLPPLADKEQICKKE